MERFNHVDFVNSEVVASGAVGQDAVMNEALRRLEEKVAYLERHVAEQDKVMLEQAKQLDALRRELRSALERMAAEPGEGGTAGGKPPPPHY